MKLLQCGADDTVPREGFDPSDIIHPCPFFRCWVTVHLRNRGLFLCSWGMNLSAGQTNRVERGAVIGRLVCSALRCISHEPRKKTLNPYIYNASVKDPF